MNSSLLLDIAELSLTHITNKSSVEFVDINILYDEFIQGKTLCKGKATFQEFRIALKTIFPIYKNNRKNTVNFKISSKTAYSKCSELSLNLRPLSHINKSLNL